MNKIFVESFMQYFLRFKHYLHMFNMTPFCLKHLFFLTFSTSETLWMTYVLQNRHTIYSQKQIVTDMYYQLQL